MGSKSMFEPWSRAVSSMGTLASAQTPKATNTTANNAIAQRLARGWLILESLKLSFIFLIPLGGGLFPPCSKQFVVFMTSVIQ